MIDYNGRKVCKYFDDDYSLVLNSKNKSKATIRAVLLPNPPLFEKEGLQKKIMFLLSIMLLLPERYTEWLRLDSRFRLNYLKLLQKYYFLFTT